MRNTDFSRLLFQSDTTETGSVLENQVLMTELCNSFVSLDQVAKHSAKPHNIKSNRIC